MKTVYLVASGDLRTSANQTCGATQAAMDALGLKIAICGKA